MKTIFDLQSEAHMLIDDLCSYGVPKNRIYAILATKLKTSVYMAHISKMATLTQVERAIKELHRMVNFEENRWKKTRPKEKKVTVKSVKRKPKLKTVLTDTEMKEAFALLKIRKLPWYKRIFYILK